MSAEAEAVSTQPAHDPGDVDPLITPDGLRPAIDRDLHFRLCLVQGDDVHLAVEHRRAGRTVLGIRHILDSRLVHVTHGQGFEGELLEGAQRMLDDHHEIVSGDIERRP